MNESTENSTLDEQSSDPQISFRDDLSQSDRELAERSVATLVSHAGENFAKLQAMAAERLKLRAALTAPLMKLIQDDPETLKTLKIVHEGPINPDAGPGPIFGGGGRIGPPVNTLPSEVTVPHLGTSIGTELTTLPSGVTVHTLPRTRTSVDSRTPPYDFVWSWSLGNPPPDTISVTLDNETGGVGLIARSGNPKGFAQGPIELHAGFGLLLTTAHTVTAIGRSVRKTRFMYSVDAVGFDANATSEGGIELTALEDGKLIEALPVKLWRKRVNQSDPPGWDDHGPDLENPPSELAFTMNPGHQYTFNVGVWVKADHESPLGAAAAISSVEGSILKINIER